MISVKNMRYVKSCCYKIVHCCACTTSTEKNVSNKKIFLDLNICGGHEFVKQIIVNKIC